jgi:hypothetical protein
MSAWEKLLERPREHGHRIQLCGNPDKSSFISNALMPDAENIVLGLRKHFPGQADGIIARARRRCLQ